MSTHPNNIDALIAELDATKRELVQLKGWDGAQTMMREASNRLRSKCNSELKEEKEKNAALLAALEFAREYVDAIDSDLSREHLAQIDAAIAKATT